MRQRSRTLIRPPARPLVLAAGAGLALACCGMLGGGSVPAEDVETQITDQLTELGGEAPEEVSCPEDLPAEEGSEMTCVLSAGGETIDVMVTVTSVEEGEVNFNIEVAEEVNE